MLVNSFIFVTTKCEQDFNFSHNFLHDILSDLTVAKLFRIYHNNQSSSDGSSGSFIYINALILVLIDYIYNS